MASEHIQQQQMADFYFEKFWLRPDSVFHVCLNLSYIYFSSPLFKRKSFTFLSRLAEMIIIFINYLVIQSFAALSLSGAAFKSFLI